MDNPDVLTQKNAALRERIWKLNAAILRINASLDLDTVLHEVVEGARSLTGARFGMNATVDETEWIEALIGVVHDEGAEAPERDAAECHDVTEPSLRPWCRSERPGA